MPGMRRNSRRGALAKPSGWPKLESLEGRALLSASGAFGRSHPGANPAEFGPATSGTNLARPSVDAQRSQPWHEGRRISTHNPLREQIFDGTVLKQPMFYKLYNGPKLPSLNGTKATARLIPGEGFVFTGTMAGPIDPAEPALYVFGVNRGGAKAPGPFPQRAMVFFDSVVTVANGPTGPSATVTLLDKDGNPATITNLPNQDVEVSGSTVSVTVKPALLPPTSTPRTRLKLTQYRFTFWTRTESGPPNTIASFVPEFSAAAFQIPRR
ncbi:MAG: hypothetical protein ABI353_15455 [Isosphaeraceae bacterium]